MFCNATNYNFHPLRRIRKYLTLEKKKKKLLYNASINSQLNYASVIWMLCRKTHYLKIGKKQYKALKIIYNK